MHAHARATNATRQLVKPMGRPSSLFRYASGLDPLTRVHTKLLGPCFKTGQVNETAREPVLRLGNHDWFRHRNLITALLPPGYHRAMEGS